MSKFSEIRIDYYDDIEGKWFVDAWTTDDDNEEGEVVAKIDLGTKKVDWIDTETSKDEYAITCVNEFLEDGYLLTE